MFARLFVMAAATMLSPFSFGPISLQSQSPGWVDYVPTPSTFAAFVADADLIIRARVATAGAATIDTLPPDPRFHVPEQQFVRRYHTVEVLDVLGGTRASSIRVGDLITVRQAGGTLMNQGHEVSTPYQFDPPSQNDKLILFLKQVSQPRAAYECAYGANGLVKVNDDGTADVPPGWLKMPEINQQRHLASTDIVSKIRGSARQPK
jgi:hypothetical protein